MLRNMQSAGYAGIIESDSTGAFHIETSKKVNQLTINKLGYITLQMPVSPQVDTYDIILKADQTTVIDEVVIRSYKQAVKVKPSGLEYNMAHSPIQDGNMFEALRFIPLVMVNNETVTIAGKSGLKYYINGRELKMNGSALNAYIQALPANSIQTIEVITGPDVRFKTEGNTGVINIVTKVNENEGLKGQVTARGWKTHYFKEMGNVMLTYNKIN